MARISAKYPVERKLKWVCPEVVESLGNRLTIRVRDKEEWEHIEKLIKEALYNSWLTKKT